MRVRRILLLAGCGLLLGLLVGGWRLMTAEAQCDPAGGPCEPPQGERERRATATETRLALSNFTPSPTPTFWHQCLELSDWLICIGNSNCQPVPPLCPSATPSPISTSTVTLTPSPKPTVPTATGTKFLCLEYEEWKKCVGNYQCNYLPLCPWSKAPLTTATPTPASIPASTPLGPVSPLALGIGGAITMLGATVVAVRLYKDRH